MATLERIRQRSGLLIVIIGFAMLAFILTDLLGSGNSLLTGEAALVGKINSRTIEIAEFNREMKSYGDLLKQQQQANGQPNNYSNKQIADGVWDKLIREELLEEQYTDLGFTCTSAELYQRLKSNPNVQGAPIFKDQVTGEFSETAFQQYVAGLKDNAGTGPEGLLAYEQWLNFEEGTLDDTKSSKYNTAISKGLYYPKNLAKIDYLLNNTSTTAKFVVLEYSSIVDSTVTVNKSDITKYFNKHKEDYKVEDSRSIKFVSFTVNASEADRNEVKNDISALLAVKISGTDTLESFVTTEDDSAFALNNTDQPAYPTFYRKGNIPAPLDSTLFEQEKGYIQGPYEDGNYFRLTKITDIQNLPDSASARHILISYAGANQGRSEATRSFAEAKFLADSLFASVNGDTSLFTELAKTNSDDKGSGALGGKLDMFNDRLMVKPFSDFCFQNETGNIAIVPSVFGFHIIEILEQKGSSKAIELVTISREIITSNETDDIVYNEASKFASEVSSVDDFESIAISKAYAVQPLTSIQKFDENLQGIPGLNRSIVQVLYNEDTEVGKVFVKRAESPINTYIVAIVTEAQDEGYASVESVEESIKALVIQEKKVEMLSEQMEKAMTEGMSIDAFASALNTQANDQVTNFSGSVISAYGTEPAVVGAMSTVEVGSLSKPIKGYKGVYVVSAVSRVPAADIADYAGEQTRIVNSIKPTVARELFNSLKEDATIKDRRASFY